MTSQFAISLSCTNPWAQGIPGGYHSTDKPNVYA